MLIAHDDQGVRSIASEAVRGHAYVCPVCDTAVVLKRGTIVIPHFAHAPHSGCWLSKGEGPRHLEMKTQVGAWFRAEGFVFEYEVIFGVDRRADVVSGKTVIECQASALSINEWEARTRFYNARDYDVLWLWDERRLLSSPHDYGEYRIPAEIRHCHQMSYGRVYALSNDGNVRQWHLHMVTRGGEEYYVPGGGGDTDVSPEYSPRSLRRPEVRESTKQPIRVVGPNGHRLVALDRGAWWKR